MYPSFSLANAKSVLFSRGPLDRKVALFQVHFALYCAFGVFFFLINLLSGPGSIWFFWPMIGYSPVLFTHGIATYFMEMRGDGALMVERQPRHLPVSPRPTPVPATPKPDSGVPGILREGSALVASMRQQTNRIPAAVPRSQATTLCDVSESVLAALADHPDESSVAREFMTRFLVPANNILTSYVRLATRDVPSARPVLDRVEREDLPTMLQSARDVYDRLHRKSVIDLEVAREMMYADLTGPGRVGANRATAEVG